MLEFYNVLDLVIDNAWVSNDEFKSENCHKRQIGVGSS